MQVLKIGGNELADVTFRNELAAMVAGMTEPVVIVHGGGKAIAEMQRRLGLQPLMVDGLRITDADTLEVAQMVLCGQTNKLLVAALLRSGARAVGLSGIDGGLLQCVKKRHATIDLGLVGQIVKVDAGILRALLKEGLTPVVSPISIGRDGQIYNVNADEAASAIGVALGAHTVSFISNVAAVLDANDRPLRQLTAEETAVLIAEGTIREGMVPKVQCALRAIEQGVPEARIVNLAGVQRGQGTRFFATSIRQEEEVA